ncbi:MAG: hypothetical protein KZQ74_16745 [gamma proteobacterium symbiont of Bathyaustriella thionipta]|nr:hypothetical protein [gamma proteobacterium symbiont of Bathyaustriella thionipta]MCU7951631.1 hypothetical protein [gamma proteobacterium symbiont of Bathyaustriella thionipta]MCU7958222.1 hypothetical protein [gamma proteobacterium symbiont of Bathyaustriella thionipta]MCU7968809.1 hypothetical protein [gamma proteobacterium symbiont of Bathyaustriella thionipta]
MKLSEEEILKREVLNKLYLQAKYGISGHYIMFLIIYFLLIDKVSLIISIAGLATHTAIFTGHVYLVFKYMNIKDTIMDSGSMNRWINFYKTGAFLIGLIWGLTFFFINELPVEYHFIIFALIIGLAAVGILTLAMDFPT